MHLDSGLDWRGGQQQVLLLAAGLIGQDVEQLLAVRKHGALAERCVSSNLAWRELPLCSEVDIPSILKLNREIHRFCPDIVHAHDARTLGLAAAALAFGRGPKLIATRRVAYPIRTNALSLYKYQRAADRVIAVSQFVRSMVLAAGVDSRQVSVVYDAFDNTGTLACPGRDQVRQRFGLADSSCLIGCIGSFTPEKGHQILIRAFERINRAAPETRLMLIGDGELREQYLRLMRELGIEEKVILTGFLEDLIPVLRALDLFVFPSVEEGLGSSLLLAMSCEVPVCGSRVGGIPEVIEHCRSGYLFAPGDVNALTEAVLGAIRNPECSRTLAQTALRRVNDRFSVHRMVDETLKIYTNAVKS